MTDFAWGPSFFQGTLIYRAERKGLSRLPDGSRPGAVCREIVKHALSTLACFVVDDSFFFLFLKGDFTDDNCNDILRHDFGF